MKTTGKDKKSNNHKNNTILQSKKLEKAFIEQVLTIQKNQLEKSIQKAKKAQKKFAQLSQEDINKAFKLVAIAANKARIPLAEMAVEETNMGVLEDKVIKNHFASENIYNKYKDVKTTGIITQDRANGIIKIADPVGIIGGITPVTNPTSTIIFKALISIKTRNAIIFSPHPKTKNCAFETVKILRNALKQGGFPEDILICLENPTIETTQELMKHKEIDLILATGGGYMVKAAYSSGKPAVGVGSGNTPVVIDKSADIKTAVSSILLSKTFDNGMICSSEQSVIVDKNVYSSAKKEFVKRGAYFLNKNEKELLRKIILKNGKLNVNIVGKKAYDIAKMAGFSIPQDSKILVGEVRKIGNSEPFSFEKLSPILAMYKVNNIDEGIKKASDLLEFGGKGHTSVIYVDPDEEDVIKNFYTKMKSGRILINSPASQGAIGDLYNFKLEPSMTLGCGSWGGNSTSENVGINQLMNIKTVAERRENMLWFKIPPEIYFRRGALDTALRKMQHKKRAFIVTDNALFNLGYSKKVTDILEDIGINFKVFSDVEPNPSVSTIRKAVEMIDKFNPDVIIALGGGSPIDAGKIIWLNYENPDFSFEDITMRFMDIEKRICSADKTNKKATFIAIPTTSGTGAEISPFAVITDDESQIKYPIADYSIVPNIAIVDPNLVMDMPKKLVAATGLDALSHAIESYASTVSNVYTEGLSTQAIKLIFKHLPESYNTGSLESRENMHYAASIASLAFSNAFLGICHSMAHKIGAIFNIPHGLANAMLLNQVIAYNTTDKPEKQGAFSQYKFPQAKERYAKIADMLGLGKEKSNDGKVKSLINAITELKKTLDIPLSIREFGIEENAFKEKLDALAKEAFDDQCTGANPRYPMIHDLKELLMKAYEGKI